MRVLIAVMAITYFIGVGIALAPAIQTKWNTASAADLAAGVAQGLPSAMAWPARAYRSVTEHG